MLILLMVPVTLFVSVAYLDHRQYYWTVLLILLESMIPFFMIFEDFLTSPLLNLIGIKFHFNYSPYFPIFSKCPYKYIQK